jgi:hypothetical protein
VKCDIQQHRQIFDMLSGIHVNVVLLNVVAPPIEINGKNWRVIEGEIAFLSLVSI